LFQSSLLYSSRVISCCEHCVTVNTVDASNFSMNILDNFLMDYADE